jgi:hypothetical protein
LVVPRKGRSYDIDPTWQGRVLARLGDLTITEAELARRLSAGAFKAVGRNTLHDTLHKTSQMRSTLVEAIHLAIGWAPPRSWLLNDDEQAMLATYRALDEEARVIVRQDAAKRLVPVASPTAQQKAKIAVVVETATAEIREADAATKQTAKARTRTARDRGGSGAS